MDDFKIRNFKAVHPGQTLSVQRAGPKEAAALKAALLTRLNLPEETDGLSLVNSLAARSMQLHELDASSEGFDLGRILVDQVGISLDDDVFLNWHRFEQLDRIRAADLAAFFDDIWYPSADDLDVVGVGGQWVLSIAHHGGVSLLKQAAPRLT